MTIMQSIVAFAMIWWLVFFMVLPFGTKPESEEDSVNYKAAPKAISLKRKYQITTAISAIVMGIFYWMVEYSEWQLF